MNILNRRLFFSRRQRLDYWDFNQNIGFLRLSPKRDYIKSKLCPAVYGPADRFLVSKPVCGLCVPRHFGARENRVTNRRRAKRNNATPAGKVVEISKRFAVIVIVAGKRNNGRAVIVLTSGPTAER